MPDGVNVDPRFHPALIERYRSASRRGLRAASLPVLALFGLTVPTMNVGLQRETEVTRTPANLISLSLGAPQRYRRGKLPESKMVKTIWFASGFLVMSVASSSPATTVTQEPPMGAMREGQILLVDDGSCPAGQIKRVVGGNHSKVGGTKQVIRTSSCVSRK